MFHTLEHYSAMNRNQPLIDHLLHDTDGFRKHAGQKKPDAEGHVW